MSAESNIYSLFVDHDSITPSEIEYLLKASRIPYKKFSYQIVDQDSPHPVLPYLSVPDIGILEGESKITDYLQFRGQHWLDYLTAKTSFPRP